MITALIFNFYILFLLLTHLEGCSALSVIFSIEYVNCAAYGVVSMRDDTTNNSFGTECGPVDNATADYICNYFDYGNALDHGMAAQKG